jgi:hypothetical protein
VLIHGDFGDDLPEAMVRRLQVHSYSHCGVREFFIDNLLVRIHLIIEIILMTGLAPWEFEFPVPSCLISTFLLKTQASGARSLSLRM